MSTPKIPSSTATPRQLLGALTSLRKGLRQWMQENLPVGSGLTVPRATLLAGLTLKGEPTGMSDLGEALGMSPRNMTVLVDGLAKEGLVRRVRHPRDRRVKLVELTEAGERLSEEELRPALAASAELFDEFSPEERAELLRLLTKIIDALRARGIDLPPQLGE